MKASICRVHILDLPFHVDRPFDYYIPLPVKDVQIGDFVAVPFGGGNRTRLGVVTDLPAEAQSEQCKPIYKVVFRDGGIPVNGNWEEPIFSDRADTVYYRPHMIGGVIDVARYKEGWKC